LWIVGSARSSLRHASWVVGTASSVAGTASRAVETASWVVGIAYACSAVEELAVEDMAVEGVELMEVVGLADEKFYRWYLLLLVVASGQLHAAR
jgi:hypothetical protein